LVSKELCHFDLIAGAENEANLEILEKPMTSAIDERMSSGSLHFGVHQIPDEGCQIRFSERMRDLCLPGDEQATYEKDLEEHFSKPITGELQAFRVGTKLHVRGFFETLYSGECDRCGSESQVSLKSPWELFLMPKSEFSTYDSDGGKFRHGKPGRDDHVDFGEYDGKTVDLRPFLREEVVLQAPMRILCRPDCKGLCLNCGTDLNKASCPPGCESHQVEIETEEDRRISHDEKSSLAEAFARRSKKKEPS
jgi:uncharacterized protein